MSDGITTFTLTSSDGTTIGPIPFDKFKRAAATARNSAGKSPIEKIKSTLQTKADPMQAEAFTKEDMGAEKAQTIAAGQLRAFIERVERLEEDKSAIADDIKEVFAEMKGTGFDTKAVRTIIKMRKQDAAERQEEEAILDLYMNALGMA